MPGWLNDVSSVSNNGDHATFNPSVDPNMAFLQTPTSTTFDFNQMQNTPLQQRMQNGNVRNGSPAYLNPVYQTQSIIPSKRSRPREEMFSASPRQAPGALPSSRSQTPQQASYPNVHNNINGAAPMQAPTPYQHLQHGTSNNASPSPILQDQQHYSAQAAPQRMSTASPSPFSPLGPNYASQASPPQSDYGNRVDTPQNGGQPYGQAMSYGGVSSQYFPPLSGPVNAVAQGGGPSPYPQGMASMQQQQQARYNEMRQNQLARHVGANNMGANNAAVQHRHQGSSFNPLANPHQMASFQTAGRVQQPMSRPGNPEQFVRTLVQFMQQQNLPLDTNPSIGGRSIALIHLFTMVMKHGGSKKVSVMNLWPSVAAALQFLPIQYPHAGQELQTYWQSNLARYEHFWMQSLQQQQQQQRQRALNQLAVPHQSLGADAATNLQDQFSPVKPLASHHPEQPSVMHGRRPSQIDYQAPLKQMAAQHQDMRQPQTNGFSAPQQAHIQNSQRLGYNTAQPALSLPAQASPHHPQQPNRTRLSSTTKKETRVNSKHDSIADMPRQAPMSSEFIPKFARLSTDREIVDPQHGGLKVTPFVKHVDELVIYKVNVPTVSELGIIDIRALTMSLRSGIHSEVRLALDTLATLSYDSRSPSLEQCEDLVETLIDCAEDQIEVLAESAAEVSDVMLISPYEEVVRGCRAEIDSIPDIPEFGTLEYDLDRSVERLICITTILRNFSFYEVNHPLLADSIVVKFMATVIRYLGTRNMLLRTHRNTLDFSKDVITYLSNLSHSIDLPGKEEASCMLHFLLSFAPSPPPTMPGVEEVMFSPFNPAIHRYLPPAVDSLAKLLARDDPNRAFYKSIFAADGTSSPPYDLLTRTFALAIAPIPEPEPDTMKLQKVETRKPYLAQGMLAAEIIVTLIPGSEHGLARSWLNSQDGFAAKLLKLISLLNRESTQLVQRHPATGRVIDSDPQAYGMITRRGIAVLRRLAEKTRSVDVLSKGRFVRNPSGTEILIEALKSREMDSSVVKQLCVFAGLDT